MTERITEFTHDGLTFDVIDSGPLDGPIVVLLHGFPERASSWNEVSAILHDNGLRTLAPDQRGYSPRARPKRRRDYRVSKLTGDVAALIELTGGKVHLVGHDWGSNLAWVLAAERPDLVESLTALSVPHPGGYLRSLLTREQMRMSWYFAFFQLPWYPQRWAVDRGLAWFERSGLRPEDMKRLHEDIIDYGAMPHALEWYRGLLFSSPAMYRRRVKVPTSMVWSDADTFTGRFAVDRATRYVDERYTLTVLPGVNHWIPTQAPAAAAAAIIGNAQPADI